MTPPSSLPAAKSASNITTATPLRDA
jgi:hypothetical protein